MAVITVTFADIEGESSLSGYEGASDALAIRESIEMPLVSGGGRTRGGRTSGTANHSDIELTRFKDIASPKLAQSCSAGLNIGPVVIRIFRMLEAGLVPFMTYNLTDVFVSRIEFETLNENGAAFEAHLSESSIASLPPSMGAASVIQAELRKPNARIGVRPLSYAPRSSYANQEVERVYLNPATVTWEFAQYTGGIQTGAVAKGWDIERNTEAGPA